MAAADGRFCRSVSGLSPQSLVGQVAEGGSALPAAHWRVVEVCAVARVSCVAVCDGRFQDSTEYKDQDSPRQLYRDDVTRGTPTTAAAVR